MFMRRGPGLVGAAAVTAVAAGTYGAVRPPLSGEVARARGRGVRLCDDR